MTPDSQPPPAPLAEPLLTCHEAAELLAVKPAWIYAAARTGKLTSVLSGATSVSCDPTSKTSSPNSAAPPRAASAAEPIPQE